LEEAEDVYCKASDRSSIPDLNWYFSFNLFRFASILQGIAKRNKDGTAASAKAVEAARGAGPLAWAAWSCAHKTGASYAEASAKGRAPAKVCSGEQAGDRG
jgi:hypothetical protein